MQDDPQGRESAIQVAAPLMLFSALSYVSAAYGYKMVSRCKQAKSEDRAAYAERVHKRREHKKALGMAWNLTKHAQAAARAFDCTTVGRLDAEVTKIDTSFHDIVFLRDVAIIRCLAALDKARQDAGSPTPAPPQPASGQPPPTTLPRRLPFERRPPIAPPPSTP